MVMKYKLSIVALFILLGIGLFLSVIECGDTCARKKVGLLIVATGKYIEFVPRLLDSADKHFCTNHEVTYFVFTDVQLSPRNNVKIFYQARLGWPHDTLMRSSIYYQHKDELEHMDYIFATDADMLFVDTVGEEILFDRVATQHPGYFNRRGTYETRKTSTAYVDPQKAKYYFAGGFYGGSTSEFLRMACVVSENIQIDLQKNIIAVWNDESQNNRYFVDNPPTCILSPSYCYPENWDTPSQKRQLVYPVNWKVPFNPRLVALNKNHAQCHA